MSLTENSFEVVTSRVKGFDQRNLNKEIYTFTGAQIRFAYPRSMGKSTNYQPLVASGAEDIISACSNKVLVFTANDNPGMRLKSYDGTLVVIPSKLVKPEDTEWFIEDLELVSNTGNRIPFTLKSDIPELHPLLLTGVNFEHCRSVYQKMLKSYFELGYDFTNAPVINVNSDDAYYKLNEIQQAVQKQYPNHMYRMFGSKLLGSIKNLSEGQYFTLVGMPSPLNVYFTVIDNEIPVVVAIALLSTSDPAVTVKVGSNPAIDSLCDND